MNVGRTFNAVLEHENAQHKLNINWIYNTYKHIHYFKLKNKHVLWRALIRKWNISYKQYLSKIPWSRYKYVLWNFCIYAIMNAQLTLKVIFWARFSFIYNLEESSNVCYTPLKCQIRSHNLKKKIVKVNLKLFLLHKFKIVYNIFTLSKNKVCLQSFFFTLSSLQLHAFIDFGCKDSSIFRKVFIYLLIYHLEGFAV